MLYSRGFSHNSVDIPSLDYTDNMPGSVIAVEGKVTALKGHPQEDMQTI